MGLRHRAYNVLSGSVLSVWNRVENVIHACTGYDHKIQVIRLKTARGIKVVGKILILVFIFYDEIQKSNHNYLLEDRLILVQTLKPFNNLSHLAYFLYK